MVECFFHQHEYTIQFFIALGTCLSVIIALWLARKSTRPDLKAFVDKKLYVPPHAQTTGIIDKDMCEDAISVTIDNVGSIPAYIAYFGFCWYLPFSSKQGAWQNPLEPVFKNQDLKIDPGQSIPIVLTKDLTQISEIVLKICEDSNLPYFFKSFLSLRVHAANGYRIRAKMGKDLKKFIKSVKP